MLICQAQNVLHVELDSFLQMEKTNVLNVEQTNLKPLKAMMVVGVDTVTTKFHFFHIHQVTLLLIKIFIKISFDTR